MAPQIDTAQQVAELVSEIYNRVDGRGRLEGSALAEALDVARHALQQTRRDALEEAVKVVKELKERHIAAYAAQAHCRAAQEYHGYQMTAIADCLDVLDRLREGVK